MEMASFSKLFAEVLLSGLILFNGVGAYRVPGGKTPAAVYNTGDQVGIVSERGVPGGGARFYEIKRGAETLWVPAKDVRVTERESADAAFPVDFYRRAARNPDPEARIMGVRGLMAALKGEELFAAWRNFQNDPADEVRCAADESFSPRAPREGLTEETGFNDALAEALVRVHHDGGWGAGALCGLDDVLAKSSLPDKTAWRLSLAERGLAEFPERPRPADKARARAFLKRGLANQESWARRNTLEQVCSQDVFFADADQAVTELFQAMTAEDKAAVVECRYDLGKSPEERPLLDLVLDLVGDKSQPVKLRLRAAEVALQQDPARRKAVYRAIADPGDALRLELAGGHCQDKDVLEATANRGDDDAFAGALACLDKKLARYAGPDSSEKPFDDWLAPTLTAGLQSVAAPRRRAQLEARLKCLTGAALCPVSLPDAPE